MAKVVTLHDAGKLYGQEAEWAYCALDCTGTRAVYDALHPRLDHLTGRVYAFERALQAPAVAMAARGVRVDEAAVAEALKTLRAELKEREKAVDAMSPVKEVWDGVQKDTGACRKSTRKDGKHKWPRGVADNDPEKRCVDCGRPRLRRLPFNPSSAPGCLHLFRDLLEVPEPKLRKKDKSYGIDEDVLDKIAVARPDLQPLCTAIVEYRNVKKQIGFLTAKRTPEGRYPSTFNVGAAWTGRFSSSKDAFGRGGNLQNVAERHRHIFIADPGYELAYADLMQAESLVVAHVYEDQDYIEAHASGDVHTYATRLIWPGLPWTWDLKQDKAIAKQNPDWDLAPGHDYRWQSKRIQHGGNYGLSPRGISLIAHIPYPQAKSAYDQYHEAFPNIRAGQQRVRGQVERQERLVNTMGRPVRLFGRPRDGHTWKQGYAFDPQSTVADVLNVALWHVWKQYDPWLVQLLAQVHDAILFQYKVEDRERALRAVLEAMSMPVPVRGRVMVIPTEVAAGQNWGKRSDSNPKGMEEVHLE